MKARGIDDFDAIAPVYDTLATAVFGRSIKKAQQFFLHEIPKDGKVLILGGGTGWLLADLLRANPGCEIWYVEASSSMIALAKSNIAHIKKPLVYFIYGTQEQVPEHITYDVVIANFYFDLFSESTLEPLLRQLRCVMSSNGKLLVCEFIENNKWWQPLLLSAMYLFFRLLCNIEATSLPDWHRQILAAKFEVKESKLFFGNFIWSAMYTIVD